MTYPATFFACARTFAHRLFAALAIFALPAADNTRFFTRLTSRFVESPNAFAAYGGQYFFGHGVALNGGSAKYVLAALSVN